MQERQRHSIQNLKTAIVAVFLVLVAFVVASLAWGAIGGDANPTGQLMQVSSHGTVTQDGKWLEMLGVDGTITIPLITPRTTSVPVALNLTLQFEQVHASTAVTPRIISIQGSGSASYVWTNDSTLIISSAAYVPDSYTVLKLTPTPGFFTPTLPWYAQNALHQITLLDGFVIALIFLVASLIIMRLAARRPPWKAVAMINTPPPGLTPIQLAILHHGTVEPMDFTALLIHLAQQGYLQIIQRKNEVLFLRTSKQDGLMPYETGLLAVLFPRVGEASLLSQLLNGLNNELFSSIVSQIYVEIYNTFNNRQYFLGNPRMQHLRYKTVGIIVQLAGLLFLTAVIWGYDLYPALLPLGLGSYLCGLYIYTLGQRVTPFSTDAKEYIALCAGFTAYLSAPLSIGEDTTQGELFYYYVPYALAAKVEKKWLDRFSGSVGYVPQWYISSEDQISEASVFLDAVSSIANTLSKLMVRVKDPNAD